jgi:hypothetical protein
MPRIVKVGVLLLGPLLLIFHQSIQIGSAAVLPSCVRDVDDVDADTMCSIFVANVAVPAATPEFV